MSIRKELTRLKKTKILVAAVDWNSGLPPSSLPLMSDLLKTWLTTRSKSFMITWEWRNTGLYPSLGISLPRKHSFGPNTSSALYHEPTPGVLHSLAFFFWSSALATVTWIRFSYTILLPILLGNIRANTLLIWGINYVCSRLQALESWNRVFKTPRLLTVIGLKSIKEAKLCFCLTVRRDVKSKWRLLSVGGGSWFGVYFILESSLRFYLIWSFKKFVDIGTFDRLSCFWPILERIMTSPVGTARY